MTSFALAKDGLSSTMTQRRASTPPRKRPSRRYTRPHPMRLKKDRASRLVLQPARPASPHWAASFDVRRRVPLYVSARAAEDNAEANLAAGEFMNDLSALAHRAL